MTITHIIVYKNLCKKMLYSILYDTANTKELAMIRGTFTPTYINRHGTVYIQLGSFIPKVLLSSLSS